MNTYAQDELIPIYIFLSYGHNTLKFPINPESLNPVIDSGSDTQEIVGLGEVSIPKSPKLATFSVKSFFWHKANLLPASLYVNWLKKWQQSRKPANFIVTRFNYSMSVTCERFSYDTRAGEEQDVYFELDLREYRPYGARRLNQATSLSLLQKAKELLKAADSATLPVLVEIPRPVRGSTNRETVGNIFQAVSGYTTLTAISRKLSGSSEGWKSLYDDNQGELGDIIGGGREIPEGTKLKVPSEWRTE